MHLSRLFLTAILPLSAALLGAGGCSRPAGPAASSSAPAIPADELARVDGESITIGQFQAAAARRGVGTDPAGRRALLDEMVRFRATVQEAKRRGLDRSPELVAAWEGMLADKVREADRAAARGRMEVTPAMIEAEYRAHLDRYTLPDRARAAMIFVEAPATFTPEKRAERRAALEQAHEKAASLGAESAGFGPLAAEFSYDQATKFRGGDLGYVVAGNPVEGLEAPVVATIFGLKNVGEISGVVETSRGFYVLRLTERQSGGPRPLEAVRDAIGHRLLREQAQAVQAEVAQSALAGHQVELHTDRLDALVMPAGSTSRVSGNPPAMPGE